MSSLELMLILNAATKLANALTTLAREVRRLL